MNNFTLRFVDFKQSGFPQKPAKTISSKLGDCKDFSTLCNLCKKSRFVEFGFGLTSDYGKKTLLLQSQNFNHCSKIN
jgi:hypothetical protein